MFLVLLMTLFSCANSVGTVTEDVLEGKYRVTGVKGDSSLPNDLIFTFNPFGNRVSGNTGCNEFSAHYDQQGTNLEFSTPMNTRKYCEGKMETEMQILSSLQRAARIGRTGKEIIVYSTNDVPLLTLTKIDQRE